MALHKINRSGISDNSVTPQPIHCFSSPKSAISARLGSADVQTFNPVHALLDEEDNRRSALSMPSNSFSAQSSSRPKKLIIQDDKDEAQSFKPDITLSSAPHPKKSMAYNQDFEHDRPKRPGASDKAASLLPPSPNVSKLKGFSYSTPQSVQLKLLKKQVAQLLQNSGEPSAVENSPQKLGNEVIFSPLFSSFK